MTTAGTRHLEVLRRGTVVTGGADLHGVRQSFDALGTSPGARLLVGRCLPTAAFSRRDALLPGIVAAREAAHDLGFEPATRHVGGHLAAYDEGSLVVHLWADQEEAARDLHRRFAVLSDGLQQALTALGVPDARVGAVPGEYCDGEWSVNAGGTAKLVGTGQRISKRGWLWSAVLTVAEPEAVRELLRQCYARLDLELDPATVGSVADHVPASPSPRPPRRSSPPSPARSRSTVWLADRGAGRCHGRSTKRCSDGPLTADVPTGPGVPALRVARHRRPPAA